MNHFTKQPIIHGRVQSTYVPDAWRKASFNDLACHHAGRTAESMYRRMMAAANELSNQ